MRPERSKVSVEKYKSCERHQAKAIGPTVSQRSHHTEQRLAAHLTKVPLIRHLLMVLRLALSRLNKPTSQDHSSFRKSPSPQLHHPSQVPQATTEPRHGQETRFGQPQTGESPPLKFSRPLISSDPGRFRSDNHLHSLRESESTF